MNEDLVIVGLLRVAGIAAYREAFRFGATAAVAWDETPENVVKVVRACLDGFCLLPVGIAQGLVTAQSYEESPFLTEWERRYLQRLANGATVAEVAREASYSEREMFRLLHQLYQRLGARSRTEALVKAARLGLLDALPGSEADESSGTQPSAG
jgi:DNA-binding NarL/FixJ family response regulator